MHEHPSWRLSNTTEAKAKRDQRRALWLLTGEGDPLAKRARLVAQWILDERKRGLSLELRRKFPPNRPLYRNPVFWRYLMPKLQAMLREQLRAHDQKFLAELRAQGEQARRKKAEAAAAAARAADPQGQLFSPGGRGPAGAA